MLSAHERNEMGHQWAKAENMVGMLKTFVIIVLLVLLTAVGKIVRAKKAKEEEELQRERAAADKEYLDEYSKRWGNPYNEV